MHCGQPTPVSKHIFEETPRAYYKSVQFHYQTKMFYITSAATSNLINHDLRYVTFSAEGVPTYYLNIFYS